MFDGQLYKIDEKDPFTGIIYETYPNGQKEYEGKYKNGKPHGYLNYWYENGKKMREGRLKEGKPIGKWTIYDVDGTIKETIRH